MADEGTLSSGNFRLRLKHWKFEMCCHNLLLETEIIYESAQYIETKIRTILWTNPSIMTITCLKKISEKLSEIIVITNVEPADKKTCKIHEQVSFGSVA